jgi:PGM1 C-terminal domain
MIPKASIASTLTPEMEAAEYARLQAGLPDLWAEVFPRDDQPYTTVIVPSVTLDSEDLAQIEGANFYEEQLLFFLIRLRNPRARIVYVTSQPVHPMVLEYYFEFLAGIPGSHARARLTLVCAYDATPQPLIVKILERPRLVQRIRAAVPDPSRAYMTVFTSTPLERRLAVLLGIPVNGLDPQLDELATKSGSRRFFREAGFSCPEGFEGLRDREDVAMALTELKQRRPGARSAVIKLDRGVYGEGNAVFSYPLGGSREELRAALDSISLSETWPSADAFWSALPRRGGVVEELLEGHERASPSVQIRINPRSQVSVSSTHEQILGGPTGQRYEGCRFPAEDVYRPQVQEIGAQIGRLLAAQGVVSRASVDLVVRREPSGAGWRVHPLEIDFRAGSTTHPMLALRFLTGGRIDPESGLFHSTLGFTKYYRATESLRSPAYRRLAPEDLIEILTVNSLAYNPQSETGVLFQMIGGVSQFGRVGLEAIGNSRQEAEEMYARTVAVLDRETRSGSAVEMV